MDTHSLLAFTRRAFRVARTEIAAVSALSILALGVLIFIEIADGLTQADGHVFDQAILSMLHPVPGHPVGPWWLEEAALDLTSLGGIAVLGLFATVVVIFLLLQRQVLSALLLALGLLGGVGLSEGLKALFGRGRPPLDHQVVETLNASFPSGHALMSTVFYLSIGVMLAQTLPTRRLRVYVMSVSILFALIVGLTRIYLGAHWATDVLAGWSIGAAWAMVLWLIAYGVERYQASRSRGPHNTPLADANDR